MDFELDIGELTNTIREYENVIKDLEEQKENINKVIKELTDLGWSGEAKDKFIEIHIKKQEFYTKLIEDIKYEKNALENEEKPRAIQLKKRCEDFENCIKRSAGGAALTNDDTGIISLQYGGQFPINNNVSECTDNYYRQMNSKFVEILNLANSLSFTTFPIAGDVINLQSSLRDQTTSLTEFDNSFNAYCNGVQDMEENTCSVFSKISGMTEGISQIRGMSIISESGQVDKNKVMQLMLKNPAYLTKEEKEILEYAKIVLGEDEYKKIKETVFTYKEAEKYIKCDILGFNVGLKTYSSKEISNLPSQITYGKGGYIYTYVLTENSPPTFNGVELPNDDIITKDGQVISTKTYGYKLVYTNEPKISTGIVFVSPTEGVSNPYGLTSKDIPSVRNGEFNKFFNSLTSEELDEMWKEPELRQTIEDKLRQPGGLHEWHLVSRTPQFKNWNVTAEQIKELRTLTKDVKFVNPKGIHGGRGSTTAHNELLKIIDNSPDYDTFIRRLNNWANYRLDGGIESLPKGLQLK
ncbi:hypothetical protein [Clostridium drakei]|uniref:hypothetical protein n=1 Tax=Clostridium drakei TaxID=332101 RepID=UPI000B25F0A1|nr:hypothetical protein [Clostridium drakei]